VLVPCLADSVRPLIERLKPDERCNCIFYVPDADIAARLARDFSGSNPTTIPDVPKQHKAWWHDRLPILKHIFFDRLRHYVQSDDFTTIAAFITAEKRHWLRELDVYVEMKSPRPNE
jgi:hypothetical protein